MKTANVRCVAMLLAGGAGSRLGLLTDRDAKPAIPFGGKYRLIDFPLSSCMHSGIDTVGVLTQFRPLSLNAYIGNGQPWDLDRLQGGCTILPPYLDREGGGFYLGTADAISKNLDYLDSKSPTHVLILSGDHVYRMDYEQMIDYHLERGASATVAAVQVDPAEASRYGILTTDREGRVTEFAEKPEKPKGNLASMGIYVFDYPLLRRLLVEDSADQTSDHDFGKNILPGMLRRGERLFAWRFDGYFRDVGTPEAYFAANMDLLASPPPLDPWDGARRIFSRGEASVPHRIGPAAQVRDCLITEGCMIEGEVEKAVLSARVRVCHGGRVNRAVIMEDCVIGEEASVENCILDRGVVVGRGCRVGSLSGPLTVIGKGSRLTDHTTVEAGDKIPATEEEEH